MEINSNFSLTNQSQQRLDLNKKLGQAFVEEILQYIHKPTDGGLVSGGHGEEHFHSFLSKEYAAAISNRINFDFFGGENGEG